MTWDASGFEAGEAWHLDLVTGEFLPGEAPPLTSGPSGTVTRITSGTVTFDAGPAWARAAAFVKAARDATIHEWVTRGAIEHGWPVEGPAAPGASRASNRRERRAAAARAR